MKQLNQCKSLDDIKKALDVIFTPDVTIKWDDFSRCYIARYTTTAGEVFLKRYFKGPVAEKSGRLVPESTLDGILNAMGEYGLCCQIEDKPEKEE